MSSRSLLRRFTPFIIYGIRHNQRLLGSSSAIEETHPSASQKAHPSASQKAHPSESQEAVDMTENCIRRLKELHEKEAATGAKSLRLSVETGGCSGFQYAFLLDDKTNPDDRVFEKDGVKLLVDKVSYDFVKGATIDYVEELIRSAFVVTENPSAVGGCSCKSSFMVK